MVTVYFPTTYCRGRVSSTYGDYPAASYCRPVTY